MCRFLKLCGFYLVFYFCLAVFFDVYWIIYFLKFSTEIPTYILDNSILGTNPGLGYRPMPPEWNSESQLISFRHGEGEGEYYPWIERLQYHVKDYLNPDFQNNMPNSEECSEGMHVGNTGNFCKINNTAIFQDRCTPDMGYGFDVGRPCILIKLNKIYGWEPHVFHVEEDLPYDIPPQIREVISRNIQDRKYHLNYKVWLHCEGQHAADKENLGHVTYYPHRGFGTEFFPFLNQERYLAPIVFAAFDNPKRGVLISVECKAWHRGVYHDSKEKLGLVHFELMIDEKQVNSSLFS